MKIYKSDVASFTKSPTARMGIAFVKEREALFLTRYFDDCIFRIKDVCYVAKGTAITEKETCEGAIPVVAGGKDAAYYHNCNNRDAGVITVSASGASAGHVNYWNLPIWASDCTTVQSKDETKYLTKFIYYLLKLVQTDMYLLQKGPDQPHVYPDDIARIMLPSIDIISQKKFIASAKLIEDEMDKLLSGAGSNTQEIIDEVFRQKFLFNYDEFKRLKEGKKYECSQKKFSNNPDLRFSVKFHRPAGEFVKRQLFGITDKRIKNYLSEPIVLGASISPKDYDEGGTNHYLSMATIRTWSYDRDSAALVSKGYYDGKESKLICKGDIIMARSGEGTIGKVAEIMEEYNDIFADFTMRIRLKNYNTTFAYFYFRTTYFQYLVEINKKGLGNNTNIFPNIVQEFPIPDIDIDEQEKIVGEIESKLEIQKRNVAKIEMLEKSIEQLLISTLANVTGDE